MRIKTTGEINAHTQDGRAVTADEGAVLELDDDDAALVGLARSLIMSGQAEHYGDVGAVVEDVSVPEVAADAVALEEDADEDVDPDDEDD